MAATTAGRGDREAFLAAVRDRLQAPLPQNHLRPVVAAPDPAPIDWAVDLADPVAAFTRALEAVTGTVEDATDRDGLVARVVEQRQVRRAVVSADPECDGVADLLATLDVEVVELGDVAATAAAELGVTGAMHGIALTGSLVVDSTRAAARTASLLPPVHLALLRRDAILPDPGALLRTLGSCDLPSNLLLITGPSKSADIELILTVGVHGPRELIVGLL